MARIVTFTPKRSRAAAGPERFIAAYDLHFGFERKGGRKLPLHDDAAWQVVLDFAADFRPNHVVLGGDILDCGAVSHHSAGKPGKTEGLKLAADAAGARARVIEPLEAVVERPSRGASRLIYHLGNHERFLQDLVDKEPGLEGLLDVTHLLGLEKWEVIPLGGLSNLGKLYFMHGDALKGSGDTVAKRMVTEYERSIIAGHRHTYQAFVKTSAVDSELPKIGICAPCLCHKDPAYNEGSPNRWCQGFIFGWIQPDGTFSTYVPIIINGQAVINGKTYGQAVQPLRRRKAA